MCIYYKKKTWHKGPCLHDGSNTIVKIYAGKHPEVPPFPFESIKKKFRFLSLTTSSEAISVLEHVRVECGKVCAMSLFHTGVSKHLKLEEFDQAQHQASMQVRAIVHNVVVVVTS